MSLYNNLFGINPFAYDVIGDIFDVDSNGLIKDKTVIVDNIRKAIDLLPRFRDAFIDDKKNLVLMLRAGGANREIYEKKLKDFNEHHTGLFLEDLYKLQGFIADRDQQMDSTFCYLYFSPKTDRMKNLLDILDPILYTAQDPEVRFKNLLKAMEDGDTSNPDLTSAMVFGKQLIGSINAQIDNKGLNVISV